MQDQDKTKEQLVGEIAALRQRLAEHEQAVGALRANEESLFRTVVDFSHDWTYWLAPDGRLLYVSPSCQRITGCSPEEFQSNPALLVSIIHPDDRDGIADHFQNETPPAGPFTAEFRVVSRSGEVRWVEHICQPVYDAEKRWLGQQASNRDITERRQAEEACRESERRLSTLISNLPGIAYRCKIDTDWTMEFISEGCLPLTGYQQSEFLGNRVTSFGRLIHPDERGMVWERVQEALAKRQHFQLEYRIRTATGEEKWVWEQGVGIYSENGQAAMLEGFITDITVRKRAEEALKTAHDQLEQKVEKRTAELRKANEDLALFRRFAEASSQGFSMADLDGHLLYLNPALCRMLDEDRPEDRIGQHLSCCYSDESSRRGREAIEPLLKQNGHWEGELPLLSRHGESVPTWHHAFLIRDEQGDPLRMAVVITDMTERKQAEETLRQSHDELRAVYDGVVDGLLVADVETKRFLRANTAICRMLGYNESELLSMSVTDIHRAADLPAVLDIFHAQARAERQIVVNEDVPVLRKDGSIFYADIGARRMIYHGRPCMIGFFRDITERKQAEEALRRERNTLKHMLQSSDHERQLIAYDIHDGLAQQLAGAIMQFQTFSHQKDKQPGLAARAYDAGMTMLQQSHFEARRLISGVRPPVLDESGVVEAIAHLVHEESRRKGPKIESHCKVDFDRLAPILENAIYRIVQEALTNACNHSKSKNVRISLLQRNSTVRIQVRDWGVGFDPKAVPKNRFGLAGIRERARLLGGKCRIHSMAGEGTSIIVELPVVEREEDD